MVPNRLTAGQLGPKGVPIMYRTLVSIGCKCNLTYINNYLKTAFLCAPFRQTHDWLCAEFHRRRSAYAVRQWMDACGGTPYMQESSSNISNNQFQIKRYDETWVLTLRTRWISNFLMALPHKISAFQCAVYAINVSITNAFPPESREISFNINYSNTIWHVARATHISPIAASVWFSSTNNLAWFNDTGYSVRPVGETAYDDAKSSCAPSLSTARRSAAAPTCLPRGALCGQWPTCRFCVQFI